MNQKQPRPSRSKEEINALVTEWESSGLSKKLFAESKNINYMTFIGWFSRGPAKKSVEKKFIPVQLESTHSGLFAEISLSGSRKIVLHQPISIEFLQAILKC